MQGIVILHSGTYLFRDDHAHGREYWAWNIHDEYVGKNKTHKWAEFPKRKNVMYIEIFDIDNPPLTVSYIPLLGV